MSRLLASTHDVGGASAALNQLQSSECNLLSARQIHSTYSNTLVPNWVLHLLRRGMMIQKNYSPMFYHIYELWHSLFVFRVCFWSNSYRLRKLTREHEFKSWMRMFAFYLALITLGKICIQFFSLLLRINSTVDGDLLPLYGDQSSRRKTSNSNLLNST